MARPGEAMRPGDTNPTGGILVAALAAARRVVHGNKRFVRLVAGRSTRLSEDAHHPFLFVKVSAVPGVAIGTVLFGRTTPLNDRSAETHDLSVAPFEAVLTPADSLHIQSATATEILVTEVAT